MEETGKERGGATNKSSPQLLSSLIINKMHRKREGLREAFFMQEKSTHTCDIGKHKKRRRTDGYVAHGEGELVFIANCYKT